MRQSARRVLDTLRGGWLALAAAGLFFALCAVLVHGLGLELHFSDLAFVAAMPWPLFFGAALLGIAALALLCVLAGNQKPLSIGLLGTVVCFMLLLASDSESDILFYLGLCLPLLLALRFCLGSGNLPSRDPFEKSYLSPRIAEDNAFSRAFGTAKIPAWALFLFFTALLGWASVLRYRTYNATNFDLGIFAQMFEQLRRTGHAWTTLERNRLLTHFGVHCSPVFYLLLPFYWLVPRIETLLVLQAAAVSAGVLAVRAIAQHLFGKSPRLILLCCLLYLLHPGIPLGSLFDFHENKFLAVFLLWAVYFLLKEKPLPLLLFSALTLSVKEDAAIYVVALALFWLCARPWSREEKKRVFMGLGMIALSVAWFVCAMAIVRHYGSGVMVDRLRNYFLPTEGEHGFSDILKVCLSNLGYVIRQVFVAEKLEFLLWVLLPLGFAPLLQKKGAVWLLLLPLLVINLLSDYYYQHTMGYQYTYGSVALALALVLLTLKDLKPRLRRGVLLFAVAASFLVTAPALAARVTTYYDTMRLNPERIATVDGVLAGLPGDAEITATTWFAVHLYKHDRVYMWPNFYDTPLATRYLVCKPEESEQEELRWFLLTNGYTLVEEQAFVRVYEMME